MPSADYPEDVMAALIKLLGLEDRLIVSLKIEAKLGKPMMIETIEVFDTVAPDDVPRTLQKQYVLTPIHGDDN